MKDYEKIAFEKGIPMHTARALANYIEEGLPTGGFLHAILTNNLMQSFGRADFENSSHMREIVMFIYNDAPMGCHGSEENVLKWKGLKERETGAKQ